MLRCDDIRRSDEGESPIVVPLGLMLLALCFVSLVFHRLKQSNIVACILIGMMVGGTGLSSSVSRELTAAFIELGIILVLFMGGLSVDVPGFMNRWTLVLLNGFGQIIANLAVFSALGLATGLTSNGADTFFFALSCTLSSTILGLSALKDRQELETVHGQVILGLMALQDVVGVVSLLVLATFDPNKADGPSFGIQIAIMIGKFAATICILVFLSRYVLAGWFKMFAVSGEMLFVGTVGYALGVAGLAGLADFSPEIGGFFAGVSLSSVPYRLEIEHKVEPIKAFGVVLFFFMLGIDLDMDGESLKAAVPWSILLAVLTVFVLPSIMWALGYVSRFRSKTAFMMGLVINNISEFSLILAQLAHKYEVFDDHQYQVISFATVITLLFSSIGHVRADVIFEKMRWVLARLDSRTTEEEAALDDFELEDHVVLLGFNETGLEIAEFYRHNNQDVLVIQMDPALHKTLKKGYVHRAHRPLINSISDKEAEQLSNLSVAMEGGWPDARRSTEAASGEQPTRVDAAPSPDDRRIAEAQRRLGRHSLDGVRPRRSQEGDGWGRKSLDSTRPRRSQDSRANGERRSRSMERTAAPSRSARAPALRRSLDHARARGGDACARSSAPERRSLDFGQRQVLVVAPKFPVVEGQPASAAAAEPLPSPPIMPVPPIRVDERLDLDRSISLPGAWLDAAAVCSMEPADAVQSARPVKEPCADTATAGSGRGALSGIGFSKRAAVGIAVGEGLADVLEGAGAAWRRDRSLQESFRAATLPDRGSREGTGTNIFSVYADPESPNSWAHYQLSKAKIVVSCMVGGQAAEVCLSRKLRKEGVPFLAITNSNSEAKELYEEGCRYVIQQEYLAAKVMKEIFDDEIPKGKGRAFDDKRREHKGELSDNAEDDLVRKIHHFL